MIKQFALSACFVFALLFQMQAQVFVSPILEGKLGKPSNTLEKLAPCPGQNPGTIEAFEPLADFQSNDVTLDTLYFCLQDRLLVNHAEDFTLDGDPNPATTGGVAYALYFDRPTVDGSTLADIQGDPNIIPNPLDPVNRIFVTANTSTDADILFINDGVIQSTFNSGNPFVLWFAPITTDNFTQQSIGGVDRFVATYENDQNGGAVGSCVSVSIEEAFAVAYLNGIAANGLSIDFDNLTGSFEVGGGLPQLDASNYTINIVKSDDPSVVGTITSGASTHRSNVFFTVPEAGTYTVTIEDGKSCGHTFDATFQQGVTFDIGNINIPLNGSACVDVSVRDFVDVSSFQFEMVWSSLLLRFDSITNINTNLNSYSDDDFGTDDAATFGLLRTFWADFANFSPQTLPDDEVIFSICFTARGAEGDCSSVAVDLDSELRPEVTDSVGVLYPFNAITGQVCISNDPFLVTVTKEDIACNGNEFGAITFTPENGVAPYRFELLLPDGTIAASGDNIQNGETVRIGSLPADIYDLVVFDQTSNPGVIDPFVEADIEIIEGDNFGVSIDINFVPISCNGEEDGAITVVITEEGVPISNPEENYAIIWNTGDVTAIVRDIGFGDYSVTVSRDGCVKESSASVSQPPSITLRQDMTRSSNSTCPGINDGIIVIDAEGGFTGVTDSFAFQWNLTGTNEIEIGQPIQLGGLTGGTYDLTVTDNNGCQQTGSYTIGFDKTLSITETVTDITCFGGDDGVISVTGSTIGGTEETPYSFEWEGNLGGVLPNDTQQSSSLNGLQAGTYILRMEDNTMLGFPNNAFRCFVRDTFTISEPDRIELNSTLTDATCEGGLDNGRIELEEPIGGTAPFTYVWDSLPNISGRVADNLMPGNYKVILTDANMCMDSLEFLVTAPDVPRILSIASDTVSCSSDTDGQLTVLYEDGSSGAVVTTFDWSNGSDTQSTDANLSPGVYTVTITDTNNCFAIDTGVVISPLPLQLDSVISIRPTCPGPEFENGELTVFVSGGTAPFTYTNTTTNLALNAPVFSSLAAGNYNILIEDANNCPPLTVDVTIEEAPSIVVSFTNIQDTDCNEGQGDCTGGATASAILSDGTERTFDFQWDNNEQSINTISSTAMLLCEGLHTVTVRDDINENGCVTTAEIEIQSPPPIQPIASDVQFVSCNGADDGSISIEVLGGTPDFRYSWDNGGSGSTITGLSPATYVVTVLDANNCFKEISVGIEEPNPFVLSVTDASQTVTCAGDEDGFIQLGVVGGNPLGGSPFTWSDGVAGQRDSLATGLAPGIYFATVVDTRGCTDTVSYTIGEPMAIMATIPMPPEPACFGIQTSVIVTDASGGAGGPFSFSVNNLSKTTLAGSIPVFGGQEHVISVFDVRGCSFDTTIFINQPPPLEIVLPTEIEIQLGDSLRLRPDVFSTAEIDETTILWTPSEYLSTTSELNPTIRPINSGEYTLTLADLNGCTGEASVFIDVDKKRNVYIPNIIAPNSIQNSQFEIQTGAGVRQMNFMRIYDRWGSLIYELDQSGPSIGGIGDWDGTVNGKRLPSGVYVYLIEMEFEDNVKLLYRGDVTVIY